VYAPKGNKPEPTEAGVRKENEEKQEDETEIRPIYFKVVYVFDVSQTEGKPLPEFEVPPLTGEANEELFERVMHLTESQGLDVSLSRSRTRIRISRVSTQGSLSGFDRKNLARSN
jgi:hypothetical protein